MESHNQTPSGDLTQYRLSMIEKTLQAISDNLTQLATLEQKHIETRDALSRAFKQIDRTDERVRIIEMDMPTLRIVRKWVMAAVIGIVALVGVELIKMVK
jgi:hypothetical protein